MSTLQRQKAPLGIERHLRRRHIVAPLRVADEMLAAVGEPADRTPESPRRLENERIFAIQHVLGAEAAAHVLGDDAQIRARDLEDFGDEPLQDVDALAPGVEQEPAGLRVIFADGGARLHIVGDHSRVDDFDANRVRGAGERLVGLLLVADMGVIGDVAGRAGEDERRSGPERLFHVGDGGKVLPRDADQFGGVARLQNRVGDHHRDDVADVVRLVRRHHRIRLERRLRPVGVGDRSEARQSAEIGEIAGDVNGANARGRARRFDIVDVELRVPVRAAQKNRLQFGPIDRVGGVIALAADQPDVLDALDALTHPEFCRFHIHVPIPCSRPAASLAERRSRPY